VTLAAAWGSIFGTSSEDDWRESIAPELEIALVLSLSDIWFNSLEMTGNAVKWGGEDGSSTVGFRKGRRQVA